MSDYYVVKAEPCECFLPGPLMAAEWCERFQRTNHRCEGCLHNGIRAVLDTAIEVEPRTVQEYEGRVGVFDGGDEGLHVDTTSSLDCWVPTPTREDNNQ